MTLDDYERRRYSRHILLPELGEGGQERLKAAKVLIVGAGGLGSPSALYLAAAGVGTIGIIDDDIVDETNLQRQVLYSTDSIGQAKTSEARARLEALNPHVRVIQHRARLSADNALETIKGYDVVLDGTDNFATRYVVNDACYLAGLPNVYGSVFRFEGQVSVFERGHGPCYRCLFASPPDDATMPSCAEAGVMGVLPGVIGTMQATEAIKIIAGIGTPLHGRLLLYDALDARVDHVRLSRKVDCALCGDAPTIMDLSAHRSEGRDEIGDGCGAIDVPIVTSTELAVAAARASAPLIIDVREPAEAAICQIDGSHLIPLKELDTRAGELPRDRPLVVHCKSGPRSVAATRLLRSRGFDASMLQGGILAWIDDVEPELTKY